MAKSVHSRDYIINVITNKDSSTEKVIKDLENAFYSINQLARNSAIASYWGEQKQLINKTTDAYKKYKKVASSANAKELIKTANALKAISGGQLPDTLKDLNEIKGLLSSKDFKGIEIDEMFSVEGFEKIFKSFSLMKKAGIDLQDIFLKFDSESVISTLQESVQSLEMEVEILKNSLYEAENEKISLQDAYDTFRSNSGFDDLVDKLDNANKKMELLRGEAVETFKTFLKETNVVTKRQDGFGGFDYNFDDERFNWYFRNIENGSMTAQQAIADFKKEYEYLLKESFESSNNTFGLDQLQEFSDKLDSIFHQVEETSNKINSIIENGIIAKSVQNLSEDTSLSDSQRSLFGDLLKNEESLKSITDLVKRLIDESQKTKNTDVFNEGQFEEIKKLFQNIEQSLSGIKGVLVDVGDGEELSPLLKKLEEIRETSANIKVGFSFDLGDGVNERLNQRVSQATTRQLEAYRNLFSAMKSTGKTNKEMLQFFEPDDASVGELIGMYKSIIKRATEQFKIGNSNIYKDYLGSTYDELQKEVKRASDQLGRAQKKRSDNGILSELFGSQDLSGVIEQLKEISKKLEEISTSAKKFAESFKGGLNITTSIAEVETLTQKVRDLEDELAKVKAVVPTNQVDTPISVPEPQVGEQAVENVLNPTSETNISSTSTETIVEENSVLQQQETQIGEVNEGLEQEKSLLDQLIERIEKIRMLGVVGGGKSEEEILKNYGQESTDHKALRMQLDGLKTLTPSGKVNPDIRDMVFNPEIPTEEVAKKLLDAAQCYQDCKNALDKLFADNNIVGGKVYNDAYRFLDLFSDDALQMASVVGETREKLTVMRSEQSNISSENLEAKSLEELIQLYHELGTTTGTEDELSKISDAILNIVQAEKQLDASEMQTFVNVLKGLTFVDGDSPILKTPYSVDQATAILGNLSSAINQQNKLQGELKETEAQAEQTAQAVNEVSSSGQMKDAFQGETGSGNVTEIREDLQEVIPVENQVAENFQEIRQETDKAVESAKKYGNILSQIGLVGAQYNDKGEQIPSRYSYVQQTGEKQVQTVTVKYEKDKETGEIIESEPIFGDYITGFQALEKEIDKADKKVVDLKKNLELNKLKLGDNYDSSSQEQLIDEAEKYANLLYGALEAYDRQSDYEYSIAQYAEERAKKQANYNTQLQNALKIEQARTKNASDKKDVADEQKRQKNIEQTNRLLNRQQITINGIAKSYNKMANPDLDKAVENPDDLKQLAKKKQKIQGLINKFSGQERNSSNEKEFLKIEKLIAEYKQLAKDKLKANNPSKQQLGGENLKSLLENQVSQYNKLIAQSEKYGSVTEEITTELKKQRDLIAEQDKNGVYGARFTKADGSKLTADDYYEARDSYKINKSVLESYKTDSPELKKQIATYNELITTIEKYKSSATLIAKGNGTDELDAEVATLQVRIEELQNSPILSKEQLQSARDMLEKIEDKLIEIQGTAAVAATKKAEDALPSYSNTLQGYKKSIKKLQDGGWVSPTFVSNVNAIKTALDNYKNAITEVKQKTADGIATQKDVDKLNRYKLALEDAINTTKGMSSSEKGYTFLAGQKELDKINKILKENSAMSKEAKKQIRAYYDQIKYGDPSASLETIHGEIMEIVNAEVEAGRGGKSLLGVIKDKAWYGLASQIGMYFGLNDFIRYIREGIDVVTELDTALTEMRKVSDETVISLKAYQETTFDVADAVGTTAVQIQNSTADWMMVYPLVPLYGNV